MWCVYFCSIVGLYIYHLSFILDKNPKLLGYTLYSRSYSSYDGKRFVLGDVFVSAAYRGQGLGKKLMSAVCKVF